MLFIKVYAIAVVLFFAIDMLWLGVVAYNFYRKHIGHLLRPDVDWIAAFSFYFIFLAGLVLFVILPALEKNSLTHALLYGALFGFVTYATYDLTNLATLKDWSLTVTIVDLIWGAVLSTTIASLTYLIVTRWIF